VRENQKSKTCTSQAHRVGLLSMPPPSQRRFLTRDVYGHGSTRTPSLTFLLSPIRAEKSILFGRRNLVLAANENARILNALMEPHTVVERA